MAQVRFIEETLIKSACQTSEPTRRFELTPWDLVLLLVGPIQKGLIFSQAKPFLEVIDHLKASLSHTLDFFPPLSGRLAVDEHNDKSSSFSVHCNDAGAFFIHAVADNVTVSDIIDPVYKPQILNSFFPLNEVQNYEGVSKPLLAVQVTELVDGLFIGCTMNHAVADGTAFWHFVNSWAEISRGHSTVSHPPALDRWFPKEVNVPIRIPHEEKQNLELKRGPNEDYIASLQERVFCFTKDKIARLKDKANKETKSISQISSLQAILGQLWLSSVRSGKIEKEKETSFGFAVCIREKLRPKLPRKYFGNAIQGGVAIAKTRDMLERGLGWTGLQINEVIAKQTDEGVKQFLETWSNDPKFILAFPTLWVANSPRFDVYGNDFGWGKPMATRSGPSNKGDGMITVYAGAEEGSIDVEVCLSPEKMEALTSDAEFIEALT